ncbi:hypothetical protein C4552_02435 [Candidatus Parcubacteria bacterium]|nr:MAG: hypothetical protein C4552_02435 [Candidatus Parcubacteria bacterium]
MTNSSKRAITIALGTAVILAGAALAVLALIPLESAGWASAFVYGFLAAGALLGFAIGLLGLAWYHAFWLILAAAAIYGGAIGIRYWSLVSNFATSNSVFQLTALFVGWALTLYAITNIGRAVMRRSGR